MKKPRKSAQNVQLVLYVALAVCMGFGLTGCQNTASVGQPLSEASDVKLSADKVIEAEPLYAARDEISRARVAVAALRQAHMADSKNYEAAWKLSRAAYFVGDHTDDSTERDDMFRDGIAAGIEARKLKPEKPEGHFWFGANVGGKAMHSTLSNPTSFEDVRNAMEVVLKVDEGFQSGSAYIALGRLYLEAPRMIGGDTSKAISYLEKGLKFGANSAVLHAYLAEAYESADRDADAKKQIEIVNSLKPEPQFAAEYKDALKHAKKVEQRLQSK